MFKLLAPLDKKQKYYFAFSGGKDSVAFTHFLITRGYNITLLHFHHNLSQEDENSFQFTKSFAKKYSLELLVSVLSEQKNKQESPEEYQRNRRYDFLNRFNDAPIILGHNLNDNMETWLFGSIHGQSKLIPYSRNNCIRPFMLNGINTISNYLMSNNLKHYEDKTNAHLTIPRNYIRHEMLQHVLKVNKGFESMIKRKLIRKYSQ